MRLVAWFLMLVVAMGADLQWNQAMLQGRELQHAGRYSEAQSVLAMALRIAQADGGQVVLASSLAALGSVYQDLGRTADAERAYLSALDADPEFIEAVNGLASLYFETRQLAKAEKLTLRCLALDEKYNAGDPLVIAQELGNLAAVYQSEREYAKADDFFLKAIDKFEKNGGGNSSSLASILHNLGSMRFEAGKPQQAARYVERALSIWEMKLGRDHPVYAQGLAHLAYIYNRIGRREDAERLWKQSLSILESRLGPEHPTYVRLARAYRHRSSQGNASEQYTVDYRDLGRR